MQIEREYVDVIKNPIIVLTIFHWGRIEATTKPNQISRRSAWHPVCFVLTIVCLSVHTVNYLAKLRLNSGHKIRLTHSNTGSIEIGFDVRFVLCPAKCCSHLIHHANIATHRVAHVPKRIDGVNHINTLTFEHFAHCTHICSNHLIHRRKSFILRH